MVRKQTIDSLTLLLERTYPVTTAEDSAVALALVEKRTFDVVVLDLMMPVLDGNRLLGAREARATACPRAVRRRAGRAPRRPGSRTGRPS